VSPIDTAVTDATGSFSDFCIAETPTVPFAGPWDDVVVVTLDGISASFTITQTPEAYG
jgi:hypothetical protein